MSTVVVYLDAEVVLGGFIHRAHFSDYYVAFSLAFPDLRARHDQCNLIFYRKVNSLSKPSKAIQRDVLNWHTGYRACLRVWLPAYYGGRQ